MTIDARVTVGIPTFNRAELLRESMASVLAQTYHDFRLLVCDNASQDNTAEVVASFGDSRIDYVRSDENLGMIANYNRALDLAETEFVVLLPDDDLLYPDHLRRTVDVLERHPRVGVAHTAFDLIDRSSRVIEHAKGLFKFRGPLCIESGKDYLERSMRSTWTVCWPSAIFRKQAYTDAGGKRADEEPLADVPLLMRVACSWDFACLSDTLAAARIHPGAATAALGTWTGEGYSLHDQQPKVLYHHRMRFLDEASLPEKRASRYRAITRDTLRRDRVEVLATRAGAGSPWMSTWRTLAELARAEPRTVLLPTTWRLCAAQLGGRHAKRAAHWLLEKPA